MLTDEELLRIAKVECEAKSIHWILPIKIERRRTPRYLRFFLGDRNVAHVIIGARLVCSSYVVIECNTGQVLSSFRHIR